MCHTTGLDSESVAGVHSNHLNFGQGMERSNPTWFPAKGHVFCATQNTQFRYWCRNSVSVSIIRGAKVPHFFMEVTGHIELRKNGDLVLKGHDAKVQELLNEFLKTGDHIDLAVTFSLLRKKSKTNAQLGYLYGHLAPLAYQFLREAGWFQINSKEAAISFLKEEIGLCEVTFNEFTGEEKKSLISLADATTKQMDNAIALLTVILLEAGFEVMSPDEYKRGKKWAKKE